MSHQNRTMDLGILQAKIIQIGNSFKKLGIDKLKLKSK